MEQYEDIELVCLCGQPFTWQAGEQKFMNQLLLNGKLDRLDSVGNVVAGKVTPPKRCKECRLRNKKEREGQ